MTSNGMDGTKMSDLIERMREERDHYRDKYIEHLDEIERLIGERDRQYDQNVEQQMLIAKLQAVVDAVTGGIPSEITEALAALEVDDD